MNKHGKMVLHLYVNIRSVEAEILTDRYRLEAILNFAATDRQGAEPTCSRWFLKILQRAVSSCQISTRKRGNCECIATRGTRRTAVPIRFNFIARAKFELPQPMRCRLSAFLLLIRHVTLWPWTLTPWPWPLTWPCTRIVDRLRHGQTLYEIWAKSDNPRWSYCSLNILPYDLEHYHVLRYAVG